MISFSCSLPLFLLFFLGVLVALSGLLAGDMLTILFFSTRRGSCSNPACLRLSREDWGFHSIDGAVEKSGLVMGDEVLGRRDRSESMVNGGGVDCKKGMFG